MNIKIFINLKIRLENTVICANIFFCFIRTTTAVEFIEALKGICWIP